MNDRPGPALDKIESACSLPAPTTFQLQSFQARLQLIRDLGVATTFVENALGIVTGKLNQTRRDCGCARVFVWLGPESPDGDRSSEQPRVDIDRLIQTIQAALKLEQGNANDLCICASGTDSDLGFAEACHQLGARVRLMSRTAVGEERNQPLWPFTETSQPQRWETLIEAGDRIELWRDDEHLGPANEDVGDCTVALRRHHEWVLDTVEMESESPSWQALPKRRVVGGLFLLDGQPDLSARPRLVEFRDLISRLGGEMRPVSVEPGPTV
jgi:hypothetical protein